MIPLKQSFSWDGFARTGIEPEALARGAVEIGYAGVDLVEPELWPLLQAYGLRVACITGHRLAPEGLNRRENRAALEQEIRPRLELAGKAQIPYALCFSGNRYGVDAAAAAEITAENLIYFGDMAQDYGVTLLLELLSSKTPGRDYQADHSDWAIGVCQQVNQPNVKLLYDIFHMQIMEGDIIRTIQAGHACFGHYHTAGNPGRNDLDETQELYYPAIVRAIAATGYQGYLGHEFFPKGEPLAALKAAYDLCNNAVFEV